MSEKIISVVMVEEHQLHRLFSSEKLQKKVDKLSTKEICKSHQNSRIVELNWTKTMSQRVVNKNLSC